MNDLHLYSWKIQIPNYPILGPFPDGIVTGKCQVGRLYNEEDIFKLALKMHSWIPKNASLLDVKYLGVKHA